MEALSGLIGHVNLNAADKRGRAAVHFAAVNGFSRMIDTLVRHGADPVLGDVNGNTPLHLAVVSNRTDVVMTLLRHGASVDEKDRFMRTPLDLVQSRLEIMTEYISSNSMGIPSRMVDELKQVSMYCIDVS
jgi:ankyrin repeat protein